MLELMLPALVAALLLAASHGYLGIHIIARGVIFVDLALAQVAALGYTAATLIGFGPSSAVAYGMGLGATLLGALVFSLSRIRHAFITQEAIIGIVYVVASAGTILLAAQAPRGSEHVEELLTGTLLWVTWPQILKTALAYMLIFGIHWLFRNRFLTISLHPETAEEKKWSLGGWDFLFYALFGVVVTLSVAIAGVLLVFSFLVIPAVIAFLFTRRPGTLLAIALSSGTAATVLGLVVSFQTDLPTGPAVVCAFGVTLVLAFLLRRVWRPRLERIPVPESASAPVDG
ncbi:MAG: metal ABC transporter permease [Gemmatimonadota bacterium]